MEDDFNSLESQDDDVDIFSLDVDTNFQPATPNVHYTHKLIPGTDGDVHVITVDVLPERLEPAVKLLEKIAKRVRKLQKGMMEYQVNEPKTFSLILPNRQIDYVRVPITVSCVMPKINGWTFAASVEFVELADGTSAPILKQVPGLDITLPEPYRTTTRKCDHCGVSRARNKVYILTKDGCFTQVGHACLEDFSGAGMDVEKIQNFIFKELDEIGGFGGSSGGLGERTTKQVIQVAYSIARKEGGFVSKAQAVRFNNAIPRDDPKRAKKYISTTGCKVSHFLWPPDFKSLDAIPKRKAEKAYADWCASVGPTDETNAELVPILEKFMAKSVETTYDYNVRTLLQTAYLRHDQVGMAVSFLAGHFLTQIRIAERALDKTGAEYFPGANHKGDKIEVEATQVFHKFFENNFKGTTLIKFVDDNGHIFIWWASTGAEFNDGTTVSLKGTVKGFEERDGKKQVVLTRCKIVKVEKKEVADASN